MKKCKMCNEEKDSSCFGRAPENADRLRGTCKDCDKIKQKAYRLRTGNACTRKYEKTKSGFLMRLYRNMESRITGVQKKKHYLYAGKELLPRKDFYNWAMGSDDFHFLFARWEQSGYEIKLTPSVDRNNSDVGYVLANMVWRTQSENSGRSGQKLRKPILQYDLGGKFIAEYESLTAAAEATKITKVHNLSYCATNKTKTAGGYKWKYKESSLK